MITDTRETEDVAVAPRPRTAGRARGLPGPRRPECPRKPPVRPVEAGGRGEMTADADLAAGGRLTPRLRPGSRVCACGGCNEFFGSDSAFQLHRVGDWDDRRCLTVEEMRARGLELNGRGYWTRTWDSAPAGDDQFVPLGEEMSDLDLG